MIPIFSIGIPAFKSQFLKQCIDSILSQTFVEFELIVINDCSPYPVDTIMDSYNDDRIKYIKNEVNIGAEHVVDNWNKCVEQACGEYFVLMGDDDMMAINYLEEFLNLINRYPGLDVYHCRSKLINENDTEIGLTPSCPDFESVYDNIWHRINGYRRQFISDFLYRTESLKQRGGYYKLPLAWGSDDISAYLACGQKGIAHTNVPIFKYRNHSNSISSSGNEELKMEAVILQSAWYNEFLKTDPADAQDKIQHAFLKKNINKLIQKKKIAVMSDSLNEKFLTKLILWFKKRKKYKYSTIELAYSIFESFKLKMVKSTY